MLEISDANFDTNDIRNKVHSLKTIQTTKTGKNLAYWLVGILVVSFLCLFLPWQQNIEGTGFITALTPQDRPQEVQTAIAGRIKEWRVREGQFVQKGDTLIVLDEIKAEYFDPELLDRISEQLEAKEKGITANTNKIQAVETLIAARQNALLLSLQKARNKYKQAKLKVTIDSANYQAAQLNLTIAQRQFKSYDNLFQANADGDIPLISRTDWEKRRQKLQETEAKVVSAQNKYALAQNELVNAQIQLSSLEAEYADKIAKAQSDLNSTQASLADKEESYAKLKNYYSNISIRNQQYYVLAPQDGYVVQTLKSGVGEILKESQAVCTIQPSTPQVAAEVYINAMDVPLISIGRHVRLEFDGWPALQVTGWPSVAVGTFGGTISVIDFVDSKDGRYRILVTPAENEPWPDQLRVGSGVYGWVMLDDVPIWYEIWRQLNGFPPSLYEDPNKDKDKDKKEKKSEKKIKIKVKK